MLPHGAKAEESKNLSKKLRESVLTKPNLTQTPLAGHSDPPTKLPQERFPWRTNIVTTTFWVGEDAAKNNPVPNHASSWDGQWAQNYGGTDDPERKNRANFIPVKFTPRQNPFYIALPYNDINKSGHKPEAAAVIPWFKEAFRGPGKTVLKGRWIAIRFKDKVCYAQWEDCGPFRTDHWQYVFGNERPKPNLNKGAGLDVSPAVRDFLGMNDTDVTDWKFVDFKDVPPGPWAQHGDNNTFVQMKRAQSGELAMNDNKHFNPSNTPGIPTPVSTPTTTAPAPAKGALVSGGAMEVFQPIR